MEKKKEIFPKRHPIIFNLMLMVVAFVVICYVVLLSLDIFTEHDKAKTVPDVRNMQVSQAINTLQAQGFHWEITDSVYNDEYNLGAVVEQTPKENSSVKSNRTIYLTVNFSSPRTIALPNVKDMSVKQGESTLKGLGFSNVSIDYIESPYKDLIIDVYVNGRQMEPGTKVLPIAAIELKVGNGMETDSIGTESIDPYADGTEGLFLD